MLRANHQLLSGELTDPDTDNEPASKKPRTAAQGKRKEKKKMRKKDAKQRRKLSALDKQAESAVRTAQANAMVFHDFNFRRCAEYGESEWPTPPTTLITWDDEIPRLAKSGDHFDLAYYLPSDVSAANVVSIPTYGAKHSLIQ